MYGQGFYVFHCPLSMLYPLLSSEEVPVLCLPQIRKGPSIVFMVIYSYVVYRNSSIPDTALSVTKREVDEEWNEHANELSPAITDNQSNANLST